MHKYVSILCQFVLSTKHNLFIESIILSTKNKCFDNAETTVL